MVSAGDYLAAEPIVGQWQSAAPGNPEAARYGAMLAARATPASDSSTAALSDSLRLLRVDEPSALQSSRHQRDGAKQRLP